MKIHQDWEELTLSTQKIIFVTEIHRFVIGQEMYTSPQRATSVENCETLKIAKRQKLRNVKNCDTFLRYSPKMFYL